MISQLLLHYCPDILINHQRPTFPANTSLSALSMDIFVISTATLRHSQSCHPNTTLSSTHYYYFCCLLLSAFSASFSFATFLSLAFFALTIVCCQHLAACLDIAFIVAIACNLQLPNVTVWHATA